MRATEKMMNIERKQNTRTKKQKRERDYYRVKMRIIKRIRREKTARGLLAYFC